MPNPLLQVEITNEDVRRVNQQMMDGERAVPESDDDTDGKWKMWVLGIVFLILIAWLIGWALNEDRRRRWKAKADDLDNRLRKRPDDDVQLHELTEAEINEAWRKAGEQIRQTCGPLV